MNRSYRISGLSPEPFRPLYGLDDAALAERGARRMVVDAKPGFPCRITLADAEPGETVLLVHHEHHDADTPYRASHAVFVREGADAMVTFEDQVPPVLRGRLLSVRAFDAAGMMTDADVVEGNALDPLIQRMFADQAVERLHVHNARPGCFAAYVDRR
jgi:hypothetical protein